MPPPKKHKPKKNLKDFTAVPLDYESPQARSVETFSVANAAGPSRSATRSTTPTSHSTVATNNTDPSHNKNKIQNISNGNGNKYKNNKHNHNHNQYNNNQFSRQYQGNGKGNNTFKRQSSHSIQKNLINRRVNQSINDNSNNIEYSVLSSNVRYNNNKKGKSLQVEQQSFVAEDDWTEYSDLSKIPTSNTQHEQEKQEQHPSSSPSSPEQFVIFDDSSSSAFEVEQELIQEPEALPEPEPELKDNDIQQWSQRNQQNQTYPEPVIEYSVLSKNYKPPQESTQDKFNVQQDSQQNDNKQDGDSDSSALWFVDESSHNNNNDNDNDHNNNNHDDSDDDDDQIIYIPQSQRALGTETNTQPEYSTLSNFFNKNNQQSQSTSSSRHRVINDDIIIFDSETDNNNKSQNTSFNNKINTSGISKKKAQKLKRQQKKEARRQRKRGINKLVSNFERSFTNIDGDENSSSDDNDDSVIVLDSDQSQNNTKKKKQQQQQQGKPSRRRYGSDIDWGESDDDSSSSSSTATPTQGTSSNHKWSTPEPQEEQSQSTNSKRRTSTYEDFYNQNDNEDEDSEQAHEIYLDPSKAMKFVRALSADPDPVVHDLTSEEEDDADESITSSQLDSMQKFVSENNSGSGSDSSSESGSGSESESESESEFDSDIEFDSNFEDSEQDDDYDNAEEELATWYDDDDEYLGKVQNVLRNNKQILSLNGRKGRKQRKQLAREIEKGKDIEHLIQVHNRKNKKIDQKMPNWDDEIFAPELRSRWQKDREKKREIKRRRQEEREQTNTVSLDLVNEQIRTFITQQTSQTQLYLPSMSSGKRAGTHLLAIEYSLLCKSQGSKHNRTVVVTKNNKTSLPRDPKKSNNIQCILKASRGVPSSKPNRKGGKVTGLWHALIGESRAAKPNKKSIKHHKKASKDTKGKSKSKSTSTSKSGGGQGWNVDGRRVAEGVERIDENNVGFKMLQKFGWNEGATIGRNGTGSADPLSAVIKTDRRGLGG